jgi:putative Mn2+ efflux pump MntP
MVYDLKEIKLGFTSMALIWLVVTILIIFVEIKIGKVIGIRLSKESGLVLGIILIVMGVTLFIGIPIIIYSNKNKDQEKNI